MKSRISKKSSVSFTPWECVLDDTHGASLNPIGHLSAQSWGWLADMHNTVKLASYPMKIYYWLESAWLLRCIARCLFYPMIKLPTVSNQWIMLVWWVVSFHVFVLHTKKYNGQYNIQENHPIDIGKLSNALSLPLVWQFFIEIWMASVSHPPPKD